MATIDSKSTLVFVFRYVDGIHHCSAVRIILTLPVVPRDRWFICWVRGPIMLAGCMDIVWSMAGVITAPWRKEGRDKEKVRGEGSNRREEILYIL